jgi:NADPH2:quinone reductase
VNPVDWKIREGMLQGVLPHAFPIVLGWDVAGIVEELGEGASRFRKGDKVWAYARKPVIQWGTWAEFVAVAESAASILPPRLLFEEAASVPLAALTAHQALLRAGVRAGDVVLVPGAAGGVGHFALQLAKYLGARVYGTAGTTNQEFVLGQGADGAIDYTREDFREAFRRLCPEGAHVVLDCVGGDTLARSFDVVRPAGRVVSIVEHDAAKLAPAGVRAEFHFVAPNGEQLEFLASLFPRQKLRTHVSKMYPLKDAAAALEESRAGHVRGKLVLTL